MTAPIIDNKSNNLIDILKAGLGKQDYVSYMTQYMTVYAFHALLPELKKVDQVRFLFTDLVSPIIENQFNAVRPVDFLGDKNEVKQKNKLTLKFISKQCAEWLAVKGQVKVASKFPISAGNIITVEGDRPMAINGSNLSFTSAGLGLSKVENSITSGMMVNDPNMVQNFLFQFKMNWENNAMVRDFKNELINYLKWGYKDYTPKELYYFTLYKIFEDQLDELDEEKIVKSKTGFKDTIVWEKLYKFQKDGVLGAIDKIEKYGGCIVADSVGLGKTFEALAVIKYYELRNDRVLVLCPKKLRDNWMVYTQNDKRNILQEDRFNYDVLNHTDLSREKGLSGDINLETINWGNYDLVVVDESHNFRNNVARKDRETRYTRFMNHIIKAGVKTKILMLSATPVNNRMNDLKNQVAFITEGDDTAFEPQGINSINQVMKTAQTQFNQWLKKKPALGTDRIGNLMDSIDGRYFKLLDLLTIARSRKHIEKYYSTKDIGEFPKRLTPKNIKSNIDLAEQFPALKEVNKTIKRLHLSTYSPMSYLLPEKVEEYSAQYDKKVGTGNASFKQIDREASLIHLMRISLLKRMESSIHSFTLTVEKLINQVENTIKRIEEHDYRQVDNNLSILSVDFDDPEFTDMMVGSKIKVLLQDIDLLRWKQDIEEDRNYLYNLLQDAQKIDAQRDAKLTALKEEIQYKISSPINEGNKKVIVFTAFADTAKYLYANISDWAKKEFGLSSALITGGGDNKTNLSNSGRDLNELLTNFSPRSKSRSKVNDRTDEIDILIATDCISEGQNLQDCDYLINYDIHWNPVRIIQRFGRVDRLGSTNKKIQLVNFWPNMELDEYIDLEARVSGRMVLLDVSATGEENVIEESKGMNDLDYRKQQLEQLQGEVVNIEDMNGGVSITDLTLSDFRMELMDYMKENEDFLQHCPNTIHAVAKSINEDAPEGVIFCLKQIKKFKQDDRAHNPIAPYHLLYIAQDGEVRFTHTQSKRVLDLFQQMAHQQTAVNHELLQEMMTQTAEGKDMDAYTELLEKAVNSIAGKVEQKGVASLFSVGGTTSTKDMAKQLDDFEVVSFLIVK